jgi:hypothetical protein
LIVLHKTLNKKQRVVAMVVADWWPSRTRPAVPRGGGITHTHTVRVQHNVW